jgi:putative transposase
MKTSDVTETRDLALQASGCDQVHVEHKPRLLSDNGSSYVSGELAARTFVPINGAINLAELVI